MTTMHPIERFLDLPPDASALQLLCLPEDRLPSERDLRDALRLQLNRVMRHPGAGTDDAQAVSRRLQEAASEIQHRINAMKRRAGVRHRTSTQKAYDRRITHQLTDFDRRVLSILVGCGGWNSRSRALLVGLAGAYGVTVSGLMRVIKGLGEYARSGGKPIHASDLAAGDDGIMQHHLAMPPVPAQAHRRHAELAERLLPELSNVSTTGTIKLSIFFGLITVFLMVVMIRFLFFGGEPPTPIKNPSMVMTTEPESPAETRDRPLAELQNRDVRVLTYSRPPTFRGNGLPVEATTAADECTRLIPYIDDVARKASVSETLSMATINNWRESIDTAGRGWGLLGEAQYIRISDAILNVFHAAADSPSIVDQLVLELLPGSFNPVDPMRMYSESFRAGMLGRIATSETLPPVVIETVVRHYQDLLDVSSDRPEPTPFIPSARRWLEIQIPALVSRSGFDAAIHDDWELWLAANDKLREFDRSETAQATHQQLMMDAIATIAESEIDLSRSGPMSDVLGRLLQKVDFESSATVRDAFLGMYDNDRISEHDLWVITSIVAGYANVPWFEERFVLAPEASLASRRRWNQIIRQSWPPINKTLSGQTILAGRGIAVDPIMLARWRSFREVITGTSIARDTDEQMAQLIDAARLNAVAALLTRQKVDDVEDLMATLGEQYPVSVDADGNETPALSQPVRGGGGGAIRGSSRGAGNGRGGGNLSRGGSQQGARPAAPTAQNDGRWTELYQRAIRSADEKKALLIELRNSGINELGPIDAATFVNEVYRGRPGEVRELASSILVAQFRDGLNVAVQLIDQLDRGSRRQELADTLAAFTSKILPRPSDETFIFEARRALVNHALAIMNTGDNVINDGSVILARLYEQRRKAHDRNDGPLIPATSTHEIAQDLLDVLRRNAEGLMVSRPVPDTLRALARRHDTRMSLAQGVVQQFVAMQLGVLEQLAYITVAEQPHLENEVRTLLEEATAERQQMRTVLEQAIAIERTMTEIWDHRLMDPTEEMRKEAGETP